MSQKIQIVVDGDAIDAAVVAEILHKYVRENLGKTAIDRYHRNVAGRIAAQFETPQFNTVTK